VFGLEALQQPVIVDHSSAGHRGVADAQLSEWLFQPHVNTLTKQSAGLAQQRRTTLTSWGHRFDPCGAHHFLDY
jgi:hypothetical protein